MDIRIFYSPNNDNKWPVVLYKIAPVDDPNRPIGEMIKIDDSCKVVITDQVFTDTLRFHDIDHDRLDQLSMVVDQFYARYRLDSDGFLRYLRAELGWLVDAARENTGMQP